jgi:phosphoribosylanthranilate isomerase
MKKTPDFFSKKSSPAVKIKICGLTNPQEISYANELLPDYVGFVFAPSKRQIDPGQAALLKLALSPAVKTVGVFVNEEIAAIKKLRPALDLVQIHGDEDNEYLSFLKKEVGLPIIRAVRVRREEDVQNALFIPADYILFDAYSPAGYGGTGESFSWDLVRGFPRPFFLAGGLHAGNIAQAARTAAPFCLDVSSGAETKGKKDKEKMQKIIQTVRSVK